MNRAVYLSVAIDFFEHWVVFGYRKEHKWAHQDRWRWLGLACCFCCVVRINNFASYKSNRYRKHIHSGNPLLAMVTAVNFNLSINLNKKNKAQIYWSISLLFVFIVYCGFFFLQVNESFQVNNDRINLISTVMIVCIYALFLYSQYSMLKFDAIKAQANINIYPLD